MEVITYNSRVFLKLILFLKILFHDFLYVMIYCQKYSRPVLKGRKIIETLMLKFLSVMRISSIAQVVIILTIVYGGQ